MTADKSATAEAPPVAVEAAPSAPAKAKTRPREVPPMAVEPQQPLAERVPVHTNSKPSTLVLRKRVGAERDIPAGKNVVIYKGGNECKSLTLPGAVTADGFTITQFDTGHMSKYVFDRVGPKTRERWCICDHPGHLSFFRIHPNPDGGPMFGLRVTPGMLEKMNRFRGRYNVEPGTGAMQSRNDADRDWAEEIETN